jgi:hypothetical protein
LCAVQDGVEVSQGRINTLVSLGRADEETQKREFSRMTIDEIKLANRVNQIVLLENQVRQFVEDTQNSQDEIDHYQQSIKEYDSK